MEVSLVFVDDNFHLVVARDFRTVVELDPHDTLESVAWRLLFLVGKQIVEKKAVLQNY